MSRIEELIREKCLDGVEYILLADATRMQRGTSLTKAKAVEGYIPVISGGKEPAFYCNTANRNESVVTVAGSGAGAGYVQYFDSPIFANDCFTLVGKTGVNTKYVYYFMQSIQKKIYETQKGAGVPHVHISDIDRFEIPVPPIEVQQEIVRILDKFTELETELQAELDARKKQYEYYRDKLLTFSENVSHNCLGEVSTIVRGASPRPIKLFTTIGEEGVNWIKIGDVAVGSKYIYSCAEKITEEGAKKSRFVKKGDFILSNSMSFGRPYILEIDGCIHDGWLAISDFEDKMISDYLYYVLVSDTIQRQMKQRASFGGAVQNLNADIVREIEIPVPPIDEQQRIVDILDKFIRIETELQNKIAARHKQYEYYRDKLLTFKRKEV